MTEWKFFEPILGAFSFLRVFWFARWILAEVATKSGREEGIWLGQAGVGRRSYGVIPGRSVQFLRPVGQVRHVEDVWLERFSNRPCTTWGGRGTSARTDAGGLMRAYSMDLRERVLLDSDAGMKAADVAAKYRVSGSWVRLLKQRRRDTGEVAPRVQRHGRRCMLEPHLHTLADLIAAQPDRTLAELKDALATPARVPTVWRAVRALGLTV